MKCAPPQVDTSLIHIKIGYFLIFATAGVLNPFFAVYFKSIGLSAEVIGIITALKPLIGFVSSPAIGALTDHFQIHKPFLMFAIVFYVAMQCVMGTTNNGIAQAILFAIASVISAPIVPTLDASVLHFLGERKGLYGKQRLWVCNHVSNLKQIPIFSHLRIFLFAAFNFCQIIANLT